VKLKQSNYQVTLFNGILLDNYKYSIFQKEWILFYFNVHEKALECVPTSWVKKLASPDNSRKDECWWPKKGSREELDIQTLIRDCSEPDKEEWTRHPGVSLGEFDDYYRCTAALVTYEGETATEDDDEMDVTLSRISNEIAQQEKERAKRRDEDKQKKLKELTRKGLQNKASKEVEQGATCLSNIVVHEKRPGSSPTVCTQTNCSPSIPSTTKEQVPESVSPAVSDEASVSTLPDAELVGKCCTNITTGRNILLCHRCRHLKNAISENKITNS